MFLWKTQQARRSVFNKNSHCCRWTVLLLSLIHILLLSKELEEMKCNIQKIQCVFSSEEEANRVLEKFDIVKKEKRGSLFTLTVRGGRDEIIAQFAAAETYFSVSYTHLDVYKRQVSVSSSRAC